MNKGTALKWAARMRNTRAILSHDQLGFLTAESVLHLSPLGALAQFLTDSDWLKDSANGYVVQINSSIFCLDEDTVKRAKLKSDQFKIYERLERLTSWADVADYVEKHYEEL